MRDAAIAMHAARSGVDTGGSNVQFAINPRRPDGGDRDEPAGVALLGPGVEGHRVPHRQDRGQARRGLHPGRAAQRHHRRRHARLFEPPIDYVVTKIPRFDLREVSPGRTTAHHPDEVGGRGRWPSAAPSRSPAEGACAGLETGARWPATRTTPTRRDRGGAGRSAAHERIFYVADAFRCGLSARKEVHELSQDRPVVPATDPGAREQEQAPAGRRLGTWTPDAARGSSAADSPTDGSAPLLGTTEEAVATTRTPRLRPVYKRVDTCAAEFATRTAYMYSTYEEECEAEPTRRKKS
ncbi:MAG: hypothetical protein KatS3mg123_1194 [Burkholderiales bacterium]|nr:MAG: hypothetical protein KatS3mg123_1194 [Burkholderiales bacterium]